MSDDEGGVAAAAGTPMVTVAVPGLHGTVSSFDGSQEDWIEYAKRLDSYLWLTI